MREPGRTNQEFLFDLDTGQKLIKKLGAAAFRTVENEASGGTERQGGQESCVL